MENRCLKGGFDYIKKYLNMIKCFLTLYGLKKTSKQNKHEKRNLSTDHAL